MEMKFQYVSLFFITINRMFRRNCWQLTLRRMERAGLEKSVGINEHLNGGRGKMCSQNSAAAAADIDDDD